MAHNLFKLIESNNEWQEFIAQEMATLEERAKNGNVTEEMINRVNELRAETSARHEAITAATEEFIRGPAELHNETSVIGVTEENIASSSDNTGTFVVIIGETYII